MIQLIHGRAPCSVLSCPIISLRFAELYTREQMLLEALHNFSIHPYMNANLLPLNTLGPQINLGAMSVTFGLYLPWVRASDGNQVFVKIIHEADQFIQSVPPLEFPLNDTSVDPNYGNYWSGTVALNPAAAPAGSHWGQVGRYVYRFRLQNPNIGSVDWIIDPFAREFGTGKISAFTIGGAPYVWSANEANWKVPALADLVIYEISLAEFATNIAGAIGRLPYLKDLGINCVEVMPVSDESDATKYGYWGYIPVGYFGVDSRLGSGTDFQRFVDTAHQLGIAVVLDSVYGHTGDDFPYNYLYSALKYNDNPFMSGQSGDYGGKPDFTKQITMDFFYSVNQFWLDAYHVDGLRYDDVPEYWDSSNPGGSRFGTLAYATYQYVKGQVGAGGAWSRFSNGGTVNLIQIPEQLQDPIGALQNTYANSTWQDGTLGVAGDVAAGRNGALTNFGFQLGANNFPVSETMNGDVIAKAPLQYIENHDHQRFICNFGLISADGAWQDLDALIQTGNRPANWYRVQPYLIALLASKGIPLICQGEEFMEDYWIPSNLVEGRVQLLRPTRWDYFYDTYGMSTIGLMRRLLKIRNTRVEFRSGTHYFYNEPDRYQNQGLLLFSRYTPAPGTFSLVALNFTGSAQTAPFWFPIAGNYTEQIWGSPADQINGVTTTAPVQLTIPSNCGRIWSI